MTKEDILALLNKDSVDYTLINHPPIFTVEEGDAYNLPNREKVVKNLFIRDTKKKHYFVFTTFVHKKVDLKILAQKLNTTRLSFGSSELMEKWLKVTPGSVTPLAIINDAEKNVVQVFDKELEGSLIGCHPMLNDGTVFLTFEALFTFLQRYRDDMKIIDLA